MSDDLLKDAASALRGEGAGRSSAADATRMRIVGSVRAARRRRVIAVRASAVLLCAALGGTAWAAATGRLPSLPGLGQLLGTVSGTESAPPTSQGAGASGARAPVDTPRPVEPPPDSEVASPGAGEAGPEPAASGASEQLPSAAQGTTAGVAPPGSPAPDSASSGAPVQGAGPGRAAAPSATGSAGEVAGKGESPPAVSAKEGGSADGGDAAADALYQRAHALHFGAQDPAAALAAWDAYLAAAPAGRFAAFAHYNRALCLLRLGRTAEARRTLQLFSSGGFGGYRRAEAQSLLDAMEPAQP